MAEQGLQTLNSRQREELWANRIKQCRESGLGVQAWCAEQGLSYHTYYKWQQRLFHRYTESSRTYFYEISPNGNGSNVGITVHVGVYSADVYNGADEQTVRAVMKALKSC